MRTTVGDVPCHFFVASAKVPVAMLAGVTSPPVASIVIGLVPTMSSSVIVIVAARNAPAMILYLPPVNARRPAIERRILSRFTSGASAVSSTVWHW